MTTTTETRSPDRLAAHARMRLHTTPEAVRQALRGHEEIALLDVREEDVHAQGHPLFAAHFPLARIELDAWTRLPRHDVPIVLVDDTGAIGGEAARAIPVLRELGFGNVRVLAGGVRGWKASGGELFRDVNAPSKAFGELVEAVRHTPSLAADEVRRLIDAGADHVIVDVRRFDEYRTMSLPGAISVPGAELAYRVPALAPRPETLVIVNCAGRTRSIIGTQSLINAGLPNRVAALRNGTIGWTLAGFDLDHGATRRGTAPPAAERSQSASAARALADRAGVRRVHRKELDAWQQRGGRTTYCFDVRQEDEYAAGHRRGFRPAPGGQLVQETDAYVPVRGARIVLADDDGVRANMTASWLAQMGWEVLVIDTPADQDEIETGPWRSPVPPLPRVSQIEAAALVPWLARGSVQVIDLGPSAHYRRAHVPGAWFALRSRLAGALARLPTAYMIVLTAEDEDLARLAAPEVEVLTGRSPLLLAGGNPAWRAAGLPTVSGDQRMASPPIDRYRRPYEGTDAPREAMQAYLDWEFGLVAQLERDGTHGFFVLPQAT